MSTKLYLDNFIAKKSPNHEELEVRSQNDMIELWIADNDVVDKRISYIMGNIDYSLEHKPTRSIQHYPLKEVLD
ncbi:MAG: hypothetical protein ACW98K_09175 [Candidatus Kariarchaeaceae archaeon]